MESICYLTKAPPAESVLETLAQEPDLKMLGVIYYTDTAPIMVEILKPDVLVFDTEDITPKKTHQLISQVKQRLQETKIIALIAVSVRKTTFPLMEAGADSLLLKTRDLAHRLLSTVQTIRDGGYIMPPQTKTCFIKLLILWKSVSLDTFHERLHQEGIHLSKREAEIAYLMKQGLKNRDIAFKLRSYEPTIKVHVSHIYKKTGIKGRSTLVSYLNEIQ
ncbi:response regulator transcription factor [Lentibacillus sediminis]|uniref:response regulator transcription factor n=1 Tax=Lentibacillus sediminis TaxID=1940529 RepID=UPI001303FE86|nr:response regulator transcription factor [Lentibacillus sediminis]